MCPFFVYFSAISALIINRVGSGSELIIYLDELSHGFF